MFRKKRSSSQHRHQHQLSVSNTQSAQSAATRAYIQSQPSSSSLSSAAAATALRSLTPTPTPVENVQTKRMLQRRSSFSTQPVASPTLLPTSRNGLRRVNSSASMSARTFREQSPGRPTSSYSTMSTPAVVPPLPSMPAEYATRRNQSRRSVNLGPSVWSSNSHMQATQEPISVVPPVTVPDSPQIIASPEAGTSSPQHQRSESRNSINFSYPMNSRTNSPTIPPGFPDRQGATLGAAASLNKRPAQTNKSIRQQTQGASPRSPGKSPLPVVTALAAAQAATVTRNDEPNTPPVSARAARHRERPPFEQEPSRSPALVDARSRPVAKKPSALAEDRPVKERPQPAAVKELENQPLAKEAPSKELPRASTPPASEKIVRTPPVSPPQANPTAEFDTELQSTHLRHSNRPARTAHFPNQLTVMNFVGDQLHQPPRSLSPAKSAMKNRNSSLSPDGRLTGILRPGPPLSELSDATSVASDDGTRPNHRKKPVKVSFDVEAEVVGVAASPPTSPDDIIPESPPEKSKSKTSWFNLPKRKSSPLCSADGDEFEGVLKPRAALPSFGSIRANKDSSRPETTIQQELNDGDSTLSESDDDFPNGYAINNLISRTSEENVQKQIRTNDATPAMPTDTAARGDAETQKEAGPIGDSDWGPAYFQKTQLSPLPEFPSDQNLPLSSASNLEMPDIRLQPATPDFERGRASLEEYDSPEEYPRRSLESEASSQKKEKRRSSGDPAAHQADNDNDSSSSVYSDAEEDLDGDGFGSINAVVDHSSPGIAITSMGQDETHETDQDPHAADIPETCQIARVDTSAQNNSNPPASVSPALIEPLPVSSTVPSPIVQLEDKTASAQGGIARSSTVPVEVYTVAHMQDDDPKEVDGRHFHDQFNASNAQQVRDQNRQRPETSAQIKRHEAKSPEAVELDVNGVGAHVHQRRLSNGSDSSSSFRRSRRASRTGMSMRRTLRGNQQSSSVPSSPTRMTALSVESPPPPSGLGAATMRTTLRGNTSRKEKPSFFSTGKSQKGKTAKNSGASFASRFPDSDSDSDSGVQNRRLHRALYRPVRSMSDNDMRPVRGIPRRKGADDGDSTELEDSSDGEKQTTSAPRTSAPQPQPTTVRDPALAAVAKSRGMTEDELEEILNRGSTRKPNLLNRLSMRKSKPPAQRGKLQPSESLSNGTILEHPQVQDQNPRVANGTPQTVGSHSRLLKKSSQKSNPGHTWPFGSEQVDPVGSGVGTTSSPSTAQQPARPQTPNGGAVNGKDVISQGHTFGDSSDPQQSQNQKPSAAGNHASDVVIEGSGRKKRFSRLKKAFGIRA
ncbi:hypothetical protein BDW62DRAFT_151309 [Aspergillus aurantiobrunneus]